MSRVSEFLIYYDRYPDPIYNDRWGTPPEEWETIYDYSDYEVSTYGRVRSYIRRGEPHILKTWTNQYGHEYVCLRNDDGEKKKCLVHRLVAEAFLPNPFKYPVVRHINDDPSNNAVWNLSWGTQADNMMDMREHGRMYTRPVYCFEDDSVYESCDEAAHALGVSKASITLACQGKTYVAAGKHLCYADDLDEKLSNMDEWLKVAIPLKPVRAINPKTNESYIFASRKEASEVLGIPDSGISSVITGRLNHTHGWRFEDLGGDENAN